MPQQFSEERESFKLMVLGQPDMHMQINEFRPLTPNIKKRRNKQNLKMEQI